MKRFCRLLAGVLVLLLGVVRWEALPGDLELLPSGVVLNIVDMVDYDPFGWNRRPDTGPVRWPRGTAEARLDEAGMDLDLVNLMLLGIGLIGLAGLGGKRR